LHVFERLEEEHSSHFALMFKESFWQKDSFFSLVGESEDEKDMVFFLDGISCN
jgi:hypothetical protein